MMQLLSRKTILTLFFVLTLGGTAGCSLERQEQQDLPEPTIEVTSTQPASPDFDGEQAYQDVEYQVGLGPRIPGTPGHTQIIDWMVGELEASDWEATVQEGEHQGFPIRNVVARRADADPHAEWIILGAHFDTRSQADQDPDPARQGDPVPGANDGASGVAVLLELARVLPRDLDKNVWLVFFDAEDDGRIEGREWIMGSTYFVEQLTAQENSPIPDAAVIVDMIGDAGLNIYFERNSDPILTGEIWGIASELGYSHAFIAEPRHRMVDDHIPFRNAGIPAVDIIDFDYPYWHTVEDTSDKVSAESLNMVGETVLAWLLQPEK